MSRKKKSKKEKKEEDIFEKLETQNKALQKILTKIKAANNKTDNT
jgi:hypothetical protein